MEITVLEKRVLSSDKIHNLYGKVYVPNGEIKGIFQVVHGMTEHIGRYDSFMKIMAQYGYVTFGYDHLGHGNTANDDTELGFIAHKDGYQYLIEDVSVFANEIKKEYGEDLPYYLLGHSMGSFIVRCSALKNVPTKLIVMGTGGENKAATTGIALIKSIKTVRGEMHFSKLVDKIAFGAYNTKFINEKDGCSWLTKDEEIRRLYKEDKFCTFKFTVSAMQDLMKLLVLCNSKKWYENLSKDLPILLVSGEDDPVGNFGKGIYEVHSRLEEQGIDAKMILYKDCRHEILNDTSKEDVIRDILEFIS